MAKKYYWLKLEKGFFKRHDIRIVEAMPNGKDYILFYLKLLCESTSHDGKLRFSDSIPYNDEMLSTITNTNIDVVRSAVKVFKELNMIDVWDDQTLFMCEVEKMLGFETEWASKKRDFRDKARTLSSSCPQNVLDMSSSCPHDVRQEIEKEKEIDIEIDKDINISKDICANFEQKEIVVAKKEDIVREYYEQLFEKFWKAYPRKVNKKGAMQSFKKIKDLKDCYETMLHNLEVQKKSKEWQKENGRFIPHPTTWLNQRRWEDKNEFATRNEQLKTLDMEGWV